jgi:SAM-dependent methyltransferase
LSFSFFPREVPVENTRPVFDRMFEASDDPWGFRTRWYEARKRAITLASLPDAQYLNAYEPGCANGELAAALAPRCARLRVSDGAERAVALARNRLAGFPQVEVVQEWLPENWPSQNFDLIVLSEMGFYLSETALATLAAKAKASLAATGTLLACHWRHPVAGFDLDGDSVHAILHSHLGLHRLVHHEERDFVLDVWSCDARSVARREGFV